MDLAGQPLDLGGRAGGRILGPSEAARYTSRAKVFAGADQGKDWDPAPESAQEHQHAH
jgi:hypothetical protein